ncbi:MAG: SRPBCC family protein [Alphaproteobacteria bacterium]
MASVFVSSVLNAPPDQVWELIRDFNGLPKWLPVIADSRIEDGKPADQVGCIRNFSLNDGSRIRERLLTLSDVEFTCTYSILESPMAVENYVATLRLVPITDGDRSYIEWTAEFDAEEDEEEALEDFVGDDVFQVGFDALKKRFGG